MNIVDLCVKRPVGVAVAVILAVMFGLIAAGSMPVQLTPTVDEPIITVTTEWPGRSPQEIVDEITELQEEELKNVANLTKMESISREGEAVVTLEFAIGTEIARAMQEVQDALRQVPDYPEDAEEPRVQASEGAAENAIAWMIIDIHPDAREKHPDFDLTTLFDPLDKEVKPFLLQIDGVAEINIFGGREREVRVLLDPLAVANRDLTAIDVINALRAENQNVSAGTIGEGKRDVRVRVVGQYRAVDQVLETVVAYREGKPVYVRDLGRVEIDHEKQRGFVRSLGTQSIAMNCIRQSGANVVDVMDELRARLDVVRSDVLPRVHPEVGPDLRLRHVYDETTYIDSAISLVTQNVYVGGVLAALVLLLFLRSFIATGVVAIAIPVSIVATFLVLNLLGRTLNVVSLAGLAFAVGMVVDNAIVVLENIDRHLREGLPPIKAALKGGKEVWGAILASTLTTVAVFIPVLTIQEEAGQLFRDISIAIAAAVSLSLLASITVIPSACSRWLRPHDPSRDGPLRRAVDDLFGLATLGKHVAHGVSRLISWLIKGPQAALARPAVILAMTALSIAGAWALIPPLDYLPAGNRNLVFGGLLIPPGYSTEQKVAIAERIEEQLEPYVEAGADDPASVASLPPIPRFDDPQDPFDPVPVENFFIGAFGGGMFVGATSQNEEVVIPVGALVTNAMNTIPDAYGGARQSSIFGRGVGGGNSINIEVSGPNLARVTDAAGMMFELAGGIYDYQNVRPDPANFNLPEQEFRVILTDTGRELGLTTRDAGIIVRTLFDGAFAGDFKLDGDPVDLVVKPEGGRLPYKELLATVPIATPAGPVVPVDTVVRIEPGLAPQEIKRIEELPSVTIRVTPPQGRALEDVMDEIREKVIAPARQAGVVDNSMRIRLEGTAAKLDEVKTSLFGKPTGDPPFVTAGLIGAGVLGLIPLGLLPVFVISAIRRRSGAPIYGAVGIVLLGLILAALTFLIATQPQLVTARFVWALVVVYLLMAALFESFAWPLVILFSVPLALVGGFAGLRVVHDYTMADPTKAPQQLDVLTMLGFVILIGIVVNNAILLVHQALNFMRGDEDNPPMAPADAIAESVKTRVRPIFMGAMTSVGGMLPLVLFPGAGSEMYRGLGSVVIGGLVVSTLFTLFLVPLVFSVAIDMGRGVRFVLAGRDPEAQPTPTPDRPQQQGKASQKQPEPELQPA